MSPNDEVVERALAMNAAERKVLKILAPLTPRARKRILTFLLDHYQEEAEKAGSA